MHGLIVFAAESAKEEPDKTAFYVAAGAAVIWAIALFAIGMRQEGKWPASEGTARIVMAVSALLVVATMVSAAVTG